MTHPRYVRFTPIATEQRTSRDVSNVSRSGGRCERVIRKAGIHKIGTGVAQQSFDLLNRSPNYTARLAAPFALADQRLARLFRLCRFTGAQTLSHTPVVILFLL